MTSLIETEVSSPRQPLRYRLQRLPLWLRGVAGGAAFGTVMFAYSRVTSGHLASPLFDAMAWSVAAVLFGVVTTAIVRARERRIFGALTADDRILVVQAVDAGRWPPQARLRPATARLVDQRLSHGESPAFQLTIFGVMLAVALVNVVVSGPAWWGAVLFWLTLGTWSARTTRHRRQAALTAWRTSPDSAW